jgi:hypothetical protein
MILNQTIICAFNPIGAMILGNYQEFDFFDDRGLKAISTLNVNIVRIVS